jgi:hypothetical protein
MKKVSPTKVQEYFLKYLLEEGFVKLLLPNNMVLEVGITQENRYGDLEKIEDYCWVIASQMERSVSIDSYNLALRCNKDNIVCEQNSFNQDGDSIKILEVI